MSSDAENRMINASIPRELHRALKVASALREESMTEIIRRALQRELETKAYGVPNDAAGQQ